MAKKNNGKYDSGVNIMGSVPNYNVMLDYISDTYGITEGSTGAFEFRTEKSLKRFVYIFGTGEVGHLVLATNLFKSSLLPYHGRGIHEGRIFRTCHHHGRRNHQFLTFYKRNGGGRVGLERRYH